MSAIDNKAFVQELFAARARGDHLAFTNAMADDFVWRIMGSSAWSRDYVGKTAVRDGLLKPLYEQLVEFPRITPDRGVTTRAGDVYANKYCLVIRVADGMLQETTEYMDTALVDRVLRPPPAR